MTAVARSAAIGVLAAMRTFSAPAWVVRPESAWARRLLFLAAGFEIVVFDKMPFVPSRTSAPQLIGRVVSGAACAAYASRHEQRRFARITAGVIGGVAAAVGAYAALGLRRRVGALSGLPDAWVGVVEDDASVALGRMLAQ
jgi:uncharacterized membrane protein